MNINRVAFVLAAAALLLACSNDSGDTLTPDGQTMASQTVPAPEPRPDLPVVSTIPPSFPTDLPLPDQPVDLYSGGPAGPLEHYDLMFYSDDPGAQHEVLQQRLVGAGFVVENDEVLPQDNAGASGRMSRLTRGEIIVVLASNADRAQPRLHYSVTYPAA